jgi:hypothetical protein
MNASKPLRIGVLIAHGRAFENWELMVLDRILADPRFELAAVLAHGRPFGERKTSRLLSWCARLEARALANQAAYVPKHFDGSHPPVECYVTSDQNGSGGNLTPAFLQRLHLDLVIRTTPEGLPNDAIHVLPFGEWAFNFSDQRSADADWFGYADILANAPTTDLLLYANYGSKAARVQIARAAFNIKLSAAKGSAFARERGVTLLLRELVRLADTRQFDPPAIDGSPDVPAPSFRDLLRYTSTLAGSVSVRAFKRIKARLHSDSALWTLYTGRGHIDDFDPSQAVEIPPSKSSIKADPFLFQHGDECYLFYEAYARGDRKAHIAVGRFKGDAVEQIGVALECPYHLSYPFVFSEGDQIFMIPETHQARRLEVWRCSQFPLKWELYATALEGQSPADSVLTRYNGKWWLFTNISDYHAYEDHCSELYLFEVDGPKLTRIEPHKHNPVVIGSTEARGAGRIFEQGGRLLRPSQRNAHGIYGYGLNIMEIETLTLEDYRERCIRTIAPGFKPGLYGCHHFDATSGRYVLDARLST